MFAHTQSLDANVTGFFLGGLFILELKLSVSAFQPNKSVQIPESGAGICFLGSNVVQNQTAAVMMDNVVSTWLPTVVSKLEQWFLKNKTLAKQLFTLLWATRGGFGHSIRCTFSHVSQWDGWCPAVLSDHSLLVKIDLTENLFKEDSNSLWGQSTDQLR